VSERKSRVPGVVSSAAVGAFVAVSSLARPAWALPSPFIFAFVADVVVQVLVVAVLLVPLGWASFRARFERLFPSIRTRTALALASLTVVALAVALFTDTPRPPPMPDSVVESETPCAPLDASLARQLGVQPGDVLVDPRPPQSFHAYHLKGSCNRSPARLRDDPTALVSLAPGTRVLFLEDRAIDPAIVFGGPVPAHLSSFVFGSVPGGVRAFYALGSRGAWGDAPELVVSAEGSPHQQFGPVWMKGRYATVMGLDRGWRHLSPSAIPYARAAGLPIVDVRERRNASGLPHVEPWNAYLPDVERLAGAKLDGGLILCDGSTDCLAGEAIAWQLRARGASVYGYVRSEEDASSLLARPFVDPVASRARTWWLWLAAIASASVLAFGLRRISGKFGWNSFNVVAPFAAVWFAVALAPWTRALSSAPGDVTLATLRLVDLRRFGFEWVLALLPLGYAAFCFLCESALPRAKWFVRVGTIVALLALAADRGAETLRDLFLFDVVLVVSMLFAQVGALFADEAVERARARSSNGVVVVTLGACDGLVDAGGKVAGLVLASRTGLAVPPSLVVLLDSDAGVDSLVSVGARVRRRLGAGPYVVRSSAPDEDRDASSAGRYVSVVGVDSKGISAAIVKVVASYGLGAGRRAGVLVQPLVDAEWAGVAVREPSSRGGGVLVEASRNANQGVTAGTSAELRGRIGPVSRAWVSDALRSLGNAGNLLGTVESVERQLGAAADLEFAIVRGSIVVLQARAAPVEQGSSTSPPSVALQSLASSAALRGRPGRVVFEVGDFAEFGARVSAATASLLSGIWSVEGSLGAAIDRVVPGTRAAFSGRRVVSLGGRLYGAGRSLSASAVFAVPLLRFYGWVWFLRRTALLKDVDARLRSLELALPSLDPANGDAVVRREQLLGGPGSIAVSVALLQGFQRGMERATDPDPLLTLVNDGAAAVCHAGLGFRALPDLALERPRFAEIAGRVVEAPASIQAPPLPADPVAALAALRSRARTVLAVHAAGLRASLVASHDASLDIPEEVDAAAPNTLTLAQLESWAGEGVPPRSEASGASRGVWIGESRELERTVGSGAESIVVLDLPTVEVVSSLASGTVVLAAGGTALCHAALVCRQKGIPAVFGAGEAVRALAPGTRVRLRRDGRWESTPA